MIVVGLLVLGLAMYGLLSICRRSGKFLKSLATANAEARAEAAAAARSEATGGDSRSAAAVDVGGVHLHTSGSRATGDDHVIELHTGGHYDDGRRDHHIIDGIVYHLDPDTGVARAVGSLAGRPGGRVEDRSARVVGAVSSGGPDGRDEVGGVDEP